MAYYVTMRNASGIAACLLLVLLLGTNEKAQFRIPPASPETVNTFTQIPPGDLLEISYHRKGCFGQTAFEISLHDRQLSIRKLNWEWAPGQPTVRITNSLPLGTVHLSEPDLIGLDRFLAEVRQPNSALVSTWQTELHLRQTRGGKIISEEFLYPFYPFQEIKGAVYFEELAERLAKNQTAATQSHPPGVAANHNMRRLANAAP